MHHLHHLVGAPGPRHLALTLIALAVAVLLLTAARRAGHAGARRRTVAGPS